MESVHRSFTITLAVHHQRKVQWEHMFATAMATSFNITTRNQQRSRRILPEPIASVTTKSCLHRYQTTASFPSLLWYASYKRYHDMSNVVKTCKIQLKTLASIRTPSGPTPQTLFFLDVVLVYGSFLYVFVVCFRYLKPFKAIGRAGGRI